MAITQAMATSFKVQILDGVHNFGTGVVRASTAADTFKIALYTSSASLDAATTAYTTSGECPSTGNYTAGGNTLTVSTVPTSTGTTAYLSFSNTSWSSATITAAGAMIYNNTQGNACVAVLSFGGDKTSTNGTFQINFPTADSSNAIIRIA